MDIKQNTIRFSVIIIALVIVTVVGVGYTFAHNNWFGSQEKRAEVKEAIENNDYDAFTGAVGEDSKFGEAITEENFSQFVEAKNLIKEGNKEEAKAIFEELGIKGFHGGFYIGLNDSGKHEALNVAIENNDYTAWLEAVGDGHKFFEAITEENFSQFVEAHNLKQEGDYEGAKRIFEELGINKSGKLHRWYK